MTVKTGISLKQYTAQINSDISKKQNILIAGKNITIDLTDPENPVISATCDFYEHTQATPSKTWMIVHNLGRYPSVTVVDSAGSEVIGDVIYLDNSTVKVSFESAFGGKAYLN